MLGKHAHAWPEVYFTGIGWVPFEPTPSRGIPGAESYTGIPAAQEGEAAVAPPTTVASATTVPGNVDTGTVPQPATTTVPCPPSAASTPRRAPAPR